MEHGSESLMIVEGDHMHVYDVVLSAERHEAISRMGQFWLGRGCEMFGCSWGKSVDSPSLSSFGPWGGCIVWWLWRGRCDAVQLVSADEVRREMPVTRYELEVLL